MWAHGMYTPLHTFAPMYDSLTTFTSAVDLEKIQHHVADLKGVRGGDEAEKKE